MRQRRDRRQNSNAQRRNPHLLRQVSIKFFMQHLTLHSCFRYRLCCRCFSFGWVSRQKSPRFLGDLRGVVALGEDLDAHAEAAVGDSESVLDAVEMLESASIILGRC
jgi:hypothetical protein